jgi:DNA topoisomerase-1
MPRKKAAKPREQTATEEFFPVDADDLKMATEKVVREMPPANIIGSVEKAAETSGKEANEMPKPVKRAKRRINAKKAPLKSPDDKKIRAMPKTREFSPPKISLKQGGYELIITEKPQAAVKIANALGKPEAKNIRGVSYYELERSGRRIVVACAVGHLFTLRQNNGNGTRPVFDIAWVPNFMALKKDFSKKYYDALARLVKDAGSITIATDYDIEGEVIGLNVVRFICSQKDASRMKFSTLTEKELNDAYESKMPTLDWGQAIAGETRHYLDWFYGINLSRALMNAIKSAGSFRIMSIGRVQGPALNLIVKKENEIAAFKPQPYWQVFITLSSPKIELKYAKDIFKKSELGKFRNLTGKTADVTTTKTQQSIPPNPPFNLTALQTEAYALHGITPSAALRAAQSLYLAGLISYPRTSSQKLPPSIGYIPILKKLAKHFNAEHLIKRDRPVEGHKSDPAHPSIYPTGNMQQLEGDEAKIYNLIAKRFVALFCDDAVIDNKTVRADVGGLVFTARGSSIKNRGWMEIYPAKIMEKNLPDANGNIRISSSRTEEKETQPPRRYSPASIISELEKRNLGTKATRAAILETLYDRGYIKEKSIEATPLGVSLISTLEKHSPVIIDEKLTRNFEKEMDQILQSKKDLSMKEEHVREEARQAITKIISQFEKEGKSIGGELVKAQEEERQYQKEKNKIMPCPVCGKGSLAITYSRKNRKFFIACDAYPECKTTFSLPPYGMIKKLQPDKLCEKCSYPLLMSISKGKRPWIFCFNPKCPTNIERLEEYRKKHNQDSQKTEL